MNEQRRPMHPVWLIILTLVSGGLGAATLSCASGFLVLFEQLAGAAQLVTPVFVAGLLIIYFLCYGFASFAVCEWVRSYPKNRMIWFVAVVAGAAAIPLFYFASGYFSVLPAVLALSFLLSGISMSKGLSKGESKTNVILYGSVPTILVSVAVLLIYAFMTDRNGNFLIAFVDRLRAATEIWAGRMTELTLSDEMTLGSVKEMLEYYKLLGKDATYEQIAELIGDLYKSAAELVMMILLGLLVACINVGNYFTTLSISAFSKVHDRSKPFLLTGGVFGAVLFLLAQFAPSFSFIPGVEALLTVALNISIIYTPLFLAIGVRTLFKMKWKNLKRNLLFVILSIILIISNPIVFISMLGGYFVISEAVRKKMEQTLGIHKDNK